SYNCKQNMTGRDTIYDVLKQIGPQWQDSISSIRNNTGKNLCFWEHNNYQGASFRLNNGYEWGDMGSWNDRVSSWKPC
ncbi:peptidase inhibitor family I36 protein, partial [Streptomyces cyaneofuscatus]